MRLIAAESLAAGRAAPELLLHEIMKKGISAGNANKNFIFFFFECAKIVFLFNKKQENT
jgi:hypothetical protein